MRRPEAWATIILILVAVLATATFAAKKEFGALPDGASCTKKVTDEGWYLVDVNSQPLTVAVGSYEWNKLQYRLLRLERITGAK